MNPHGKRGAFAALAERYWPVRLSIVPTEPGTKQPAKGLSGWAGFLNNLPGAAKQAELKERYANHGLGLLLYSQIGENRHLGALDVDDGRFVRLVRFLLGGAPIGKKGKRGETLFFYCFASDGLRSSKINDHQGRGAVDLLLAGKMTLQPPTLHPETGQPYEEIGAPIYESFDKLQRVDKHFIDLLRLVVGSEHANVLLSGGDTHDAGLRLVGQLVRFGCPDEQITGVIASLLPTDYAGNSLAELAGWIAGARAKGFDDAKEQKGGKPSIVDIILGALEREGASFSHDSMNRAYMSVPHTSGGKLTYLIGSDAANEVIRRTAFQHSRLALREGSLRDTSELLKARAKFDAPQIEVHRRIARHGEVVLVDLGRPDGQIVRITSGGVELTFDSPVLFLRATGSQPLPLPDFTGGMTDLKSFRELFGLQKRQFVLLLAFLLNCLRPGGPFMCLLVEGQQGSGKSLFCSIVKRLIDPNVADKVRLPDEEQELMVLANNTFLMVFDNSSGMKARISDLLCAIATGSGYAKRKLYTDEDLNILKACNPFIINGIIDIAGRPDLLERAISIELERMEEGERRTEAELHAEFEAIQPRVLGALYHLVSAALAQEGSVPVPRNIRMADTARWLAAAEPSTGMPEGTFARVLTQAQTDRMIERMNNEPIVMALRAVLEKGRFEGTVGELLTTLKDVSYARSRYFPETALKLSKDMDRLKTGMAMAGVHFNRGERAKEGRTIMVWLEGGEEDQAQEIRYPPEY